MTQKIFEFTVTTLLYDTITITCSCSYNFISRPSMYSMYRHSMLNVVHISSKRNSYHKLNFTNLFVVISFISVKMKNNVTYFVL
jgi:hypothetical protein